jgi:hypothetical protein
MCIAATGGTAFMARRGARLTLSSQLLSIERLALNGRIVAPTIGYPARS